MEISIIIKDSADGLETVLNLPQEQAVKAMLDMEQKDPRFAAILDALEVQRSVLKIDKLLERRQADSMKTAP